MFKVLKKNSFFRFSEYYLNREAPIKKQSTYVNSIQDAQIQQKEIPVFQRLSSKLKKSDIDNNTLQILPSLLQKMYESRVIDSFMQKAQRQGRISFYMPCVGEEASIYGSAAGLKFQDVIFPQYREMGVLVWRGYPLNKICDSCVGNYLDTNQGHQMPVHFSSPEHNYFSVSSTLATQIPQASGYGYGLRMDNKQDQISVCYFGEGASSEGDFFTGVNFAGVLKSLTLFFCRNNQWAISTPGWEQTVGDGVLPKALGLGVQGIRIDGNDIIAVIEATQYARKYILENNAPFFIEADTYRLSDHSTSDHNLLYRKQELNDYYEKYNNPIKRLEEFLKKEKILDENWDEKIQNIQQEYQKNIIKELKRASEEKKPSVSSIFDHVYKDIPEHLKEQKQQLMEHLEKHKDKYDLNSFAK